MHGAAKITDFMPKQSKKQKATSKPKDTKRPENVERPKKTSTLRFPGRSW
jgi:hypothetical protein